MHYLASKEPRSAGDFYFGFIARFGPALMTSGDINADMPYFREFYAPMRGRTPALFGPIRLREESGE